jgi:hypothetical protein
MENATEEELMQAAIMHRKAMRAEENARMRTLVVSLCICCYDSQYPIYFMHTCMS